MESRIHWALNQFESICEHWSLAPGKMEKLAPFAYVWHPPEIVSTHHAKPLGLTLQAITHGNEVGGVEVLLTCLNLIKSGLLQPHFAVGFALGNPEAAARDCRFVERDLNRSFGQKAEASLEERRARSLEPLLSRSSFFLDIHQTIEPSAKPFFIFPYHKDSFDFAHFLATGIPIVTHWGSSFSKDGMCSDEFVNQAGGIGITLELGQKGFHPYHHGVGVLVALSAFDYVTKMGRADKPNLPEASDVEIFTWKAVIPYQEGASLDEGLYNFQPVTEGQKIGLCADGELRARDSGFLLFPKYQRSRTAPPPQELYRIVQKINPDQLGKSELLRR